MRPVKKYENIVRKKILSSAKVKKSSRAILRCLLGYRYCKNFNRELNLKRVQVAGCLCSHRDVKVKERKKHIAGKSCL